MATYKALTEENCKEFKNFKYSEFKCKCGGKYCNGYPVPFSYDLAKNLQQVRTHFGKAVHITSPLRCEQHNKNSGGTSNSKHKKGWAVDFYVNGVTFSQLQNYCKTLPYYNYSYRINKNQQVIHFDIIPPTVSNVTPTVARDENKNQLKVLSTGLQVREYDTKTAKVLGKAVTNGIYNWYETSNNEGYIWYRIADKQWIANIKLEVYPKKEEEDPVKIAELQKQVQELTDKNNLLEKNNQALKEELKELKEQFKLIYTCEEDGNYDIKLKLLEKEELYVK